MKPRIPPPILAVLAAPLLVSAFHLPSLLDALVLAGGLSASGLQVNYPRTVDRPWLSAGGTLRTAAYLGHGLSLELEAGVSASLLKRRCYATTPSNVVAETPRVSPVVGLGLTFGL